MSADQQDFEALRKLLKLKRHEQPPPRYFHEFSAQVLNGIRQGRQAGDESAIAEQLAGGLAWFERVLGVFQRRPAFAGLFGAAVCGLLVVGMAYSERSEVNPTGSALAGAPPQSLALPQPATVFGQSGDFMVSSTNPVIPASGSLFDSIRVSTTPQPVNWRPSGN